MEIRTIGSEIRIEERGEGQLPLIVGYGARYYDPNDEGTTYRMESRSGGIIEMILPGAFTRAIAEDNVAGLFNHNPDFVLGRTSSGTMKLSTDGLGLKYEITPPDTQAGRDVVASIRRGDISGSSFAFKVRNGGQTFRDTEIDGKRFTIRELRDVKLFDCGPVVFPAYGSATTGVRAFDPEALEKEISEWRSERSAVELNSDEAKRRRAMRARVIEVNS